MRETGVSQGIADETERRKWFLFETLQGANNTD